MARRWFEYRLRAFVLLKGCYRSAKSVRFFDFFGLYAFVSQKKYLTLSGVFRSVNALRTQKNGLLRDFSAKWA